jgi:signal transduction histidine kinase
MELHDELGQALTAIKINLQVGERFRHQTPGELNAENIRIVDEALLQMRRLAYGLRPSMLDDLGLAPALRWMAEQTAQRSGLAIRFQPDLSEVRLAPEIEIVVFRIAQEALTNIVRHAQARQVHMTLQREDDALVLSVQDDGGGFDLAAMRARAAAGGSLGVLGMEERAMLIGAELLIESVPGQGSRLRLRCPLRAQEETP